MAASGINPLDHYHQIGWHEGRDPSRNFDTTLYLMHNPDVAAAGIDPLAHFLAVRHGRRPRGLSRRSGRTSPAASTPQYYLFHNPDVAAAGIDPLFHFNVARLAGGPRSERLVRHRRLSRALRRRGGGRHQSAAHYEAVGWKEGRDPSAGFDTLGYLAANPDVAAAGINPLDHFLQFGIYEGRAGGQRRAVGLNGEGRLHRAAARLGPRRCQGASRPVVAWSAPVHR